MEGECGIVSVAWCECVCVCKREHAALLEQRLDLSFLGRVDVRRAVRSTPRLGRALEHSQQRTRARGLYGTHITSTRISELYHTLT